MFLLEPVLQAYPWGSPAVIPELIGTEPTGAPLAELWMGAHPAAPSPLRDDPRGRTLFEAIEQDPVDLLGPQVAQRFQGLPFLFKVLAVDRPLSLQAHPTLAQARAGFADEQERGVPVDSPQRNYKDANHKPEMVVALTDFTGLCGFRPVAETARFMDALDAAVLSAYRVRLLAPGGLRDVVTELLASPANRIAAMLDEVVPAARRVSGSDGAFTDAAAWIVRLADAYPGDRGALIAVLLNLVHLSPGQSLFLRAGELHAYLHGVAVEIMANSDNVLRGGLTGKHIDVAEMLSILALHEDVTVPVEPGLIAPDVFSYPSQVADFGLTRHDLRATSPAPQAPSPASDAQSHALAAGVPRIALCTQGAARVDAPTASLALPMGAAVFLGAAESVTLSAADGPATVFVASTNIA